MNKKLAVGVAAIAISAGLVVPASASAQAAAAPAPVVYGHACSTNWCDPDVRPQGHERFIFGAGALYVTRMSWSHWGQQNAKGSGTFHSCPSAQGCTRHHGTLFLHDVRTHNGHKYYRQLTLRFAGHVQRLTYSGHGGTLISWS